MNEHPHGDPTVRVMDRTVVFGIEDVCRACGARRSLVLEMVEHGIIEAEGSQDEEPAFHGEALVRAQVAARLMRDLGVNLPGAALAVDLLRQLGRL